MSLAASAAMRFPQPVRAGDLAGRAVIEAVESQNELGTVRGVVRAPDGMVQVVIELGGFLGFNRRQVAVPIDATVLVGQVMEVDAFSPAELRALPPYQPGSAAPVPADTILRIGLAKPSH